MLEMLDLKRKLSQPVYKEKIHPLRLHLNELQRRTFRAGVPTCIVFEGWDAAGKGTNIAALAERLEEAKVATLDERHFRVVRPRHVSALELCPV